MRPIPNLGALDELLRESNEAAERFAESINVRNKELDWIDGECRASSTLHGGEDVRWFWIGCLPGLGVLGRAVTGAWKQAKDADINILIVRIAFLENKMSGGSQNETAH